MQTYEKESIPRDDEIYYYDNKRLNIYKDRSFEVPTPEDVLITALMGNKYCKNWNNLKEKMVPYQAYSYCRNNSELTERLKYLARLHMHPKHIYEAPPVNLFLLETKTRDVLFAKIKIDII